MSPRVSAWEEIAYRKLKSLIPTGLVMQLPSKRFFKYDANEELEKDWFKELVDDWHIIPKNELPECVLASRSLRHAPCCA